jgi:hypothetical protein
MAITSLRTYEDWRHCIEVACGIKLTPQYVATRIAELSDLDHYGTQRFIEAWGEAHRVQVLAWFQEAAHKVRH